ncbi:MAG: OmpA family protein [Paludibacteraceae bacterium]|nr:OmpA family protein [Paludibacteraceae bacterium]
MIDEKGCPIDSDGDGVADYLDQCPGTPAAAKGFVDEKGCPIDTDGDGIYDYEDACPNEKGVKENNGCPEVKEAVKQLFKKALNGIQFETGKATIKKSSYKILDDVVTVMNENPTYKLFIGGHTDNVGNADKNLKLSDDRAAAVKAYLVNHGVDESRMKSKGFGQEKPVADNKTAKGRAENRRVEFRVVFEKVVEE